MKVRRRCIALSSCRGNARQYTLRRVTKREALVAYVLLFAALMASAPLSAHEIPLSLTVHTYVKPDADRLRVIVRLPLLAMRDMQFPERDGFLDIDRAQPDLLEAVGRWIVPSLTVLENGERTGTPVIAAARVTLPSDRSFASYEEALAHANAPPLTSDAKLPVAQALLDAVVEFPIASATSRFAIRPGFERLGVDVRTVLRFVTPGGVRAFEFHGDPGVLQLDPRWYQAAWHFVKLGFTHIIDGVDHLLFLFCLVIPFRKLRPLIVVVTAFTVAHSITLIASALGWAPQGLWFPPLVETLIAASILYLALENILSSRTSGQRWLLAFGFGLIHGFGFSFALQETLQFAGAHLVTSLLAFNVGVEIGQVLVLAALVPALRLLYRVMPERMGVIVLSALVAHTAWHWLAERWSAFRQFSLPSLGTIGLLRVAIAVVVVAGLVWLAQAVRRSRRSAESAAQ
jgi:hypothetical protein